MKQIALTGLLLTMTAVSGHTEPNSEHSPCRTSHTARYLPDEATAQLKRQQRSFEEQKQARDSDGIERSQGCRTTDNQLCSMCCNGGCCERLSDFSAAVRFEKNEQMWIPLKFTVLLPATGNTEYLTRGTIDYQIQALNTHFAQSNAPFRFHYHSVTFLRDQKAYASCNTDPCYVSENCDFYTYTVPKVRAMDGNSEELINVFLCDGFSHYDGEAQYPWASTENHNHQYVTIHRNAFGNMSDYTTSPIGQAKTMVHEMGHYLGLLHVFEPGNNVCAAEGDFVSDTPTAKRPVFRGRPCTEVQDSCPSQAGNDQRDNFMNYAQDQCRDKFTSGQVERMERATSMYRPLLRKNTRVLGLGGDCGHSATDIADCVCPTKLSGCSPSHWCRGVETCEKKSGSGGGATTRGMSGRRRRHDVEETLAPAEKNLKSQEFSASTSGVGSDVGGTTIPGTTIPGATDPQSWQGSTDTLTSADCTVVCALENGEHPSTTSLASGDDIGSGAASSRSWTLLSWLVAFALLLLNRA